MLTKANIAILSGTLSGKSLPPFYFHSFACIVSGGIEDWTNFLNLTQSWEGKFKTGTKHGTKMKNNPVYTVAETLLIGSRILHSPGQQTQVRAKYQHLIQCLTIRWDVAEEETTGIPKSLIYTGIGTGSEMGLSPPPPPTLFISRLMRVFPWKKNF